MFVAIKQDLMDDVEGLDSFEQSDNVKVFSQLLLTASMIVVPL